MIPTSIFYLPLSWLPEYIVFCSLFNICFVVPWQFQESWECEHNSVCQTEEFDGLQHVILPFDSPPRNPPKRPGSSTRTPHTPHIHTHTKNRRSPLSQKQMRFMHQRSQRFSDIPSILVIPCAHVSFGTLRKVEKLTEEQVPSVGECCLLVFLWRGLHPRSFTLCLWSLTIP